MHIIAALLGVGCLDDFVCRVSEGGDAGGPGGGGGGVSGGAEAVVQVDDRFQPEVRAYDTTTKRLKAFADLKFAKELEKGRKINIHLRMKAKLES